MPITRTPSQRQRAFVMYLEARKGVERYQWIVIPQVPKLWNGQEVEPFERAGIFNRHQPAPDRRTQWSFRQASRVDTSGREWLGNQIRSLTNAGWTFFEPLTWEMPIAQIITFHQEQKTPWPIINAAKKKYLAMGREFR